MSELKVLFVLALTQISAAILLAVFLVAYTGSPWWSLVALLVLPWSVRFNSIVTCPKCGYTFKDNTIEESE